MIREAIRTYKHSFIVASLLAISTVALSVCFAFSSPLLASAENTESAETLEVIEEVAAQRDQAIEEVEAIIEERAANEQQGEQDLTATGNLNDANIATLEKENEQNAQDNPAATTPSDDCTVTIRYLEYMNYDDEPDAVIDEMGRRVLGTRVLTGLKEGDVLNAWNYVVDIPGHFFFDGWPLNLTVTTDPNKNTFDLIYIKKWNSEYTVNYYVMTGADLSADTWSEALAPDDVEFIKMGSETFDNQRFDKLVEGDAYEYKLDDMYVIDTYPAEIRLGTDPDNNVINVLYTPTSSTLPDDLEVPDDIIPPADEGDAGSGDTGSGDAGSGDNGTGSGDNGSGDSGAGTPSPDLPSDDTFDKDDITSTLPDGVTDDDESKDDFLGNEVDRGELDVTDEMLANPVSKEQANQALADYRDSLYEADNLAKTGDGVPIIAWVSGATALVALVLLGFYLMRSRKRA